MSNKTIEMWKTIKIFFLLLFFVAFYNCNQIDNRILSERNRIQDSLKSDSILKGEIERGIARRTDSIKKTEEDEQSFTSKNSELISFNGINYCSDFPYYTPGNTITNDTKIYIKGNKNIAKLEIDNQEIKCWIKDDISTSQMEFLVIKNEDLKKTQYHFLFEDSSRTVLWGVLFFGKTGVAPTGVKFRFGDLLYKSARTEDGRIYFKRRITLSYFNNRQ